MPRSCQYPQDPRSCQDPGSCQGPRFCPDPETRPRNTGLAPGIPGLVDLHLVHNTGAAFSLLSGSTLWLGVLSLLVTVALCRWIWRKPHQPLWNGLAIAFLLGGTLGNGLDRWRLGYVVDFLALVPINFPVFNIADIAINLAVVCFAIDLIQQSRAPGHG